jgi:hypothetical protein
MTMGLQKLQRSHTDFRIFGRSECKELQKIISPDEHVFMAAYGFYAGGSGLFVATDARVLLIDKQPFYVNIEDIRYEHITRVDITNGKLQSSLKVCAGSHGLTFKSLSDARLKQMYHYIQARAELKTSHINQVIEATNRRMFVGRLGRLGLPRRWRVDQSSKVAPQNTSVFKPLIDTTVSIVPHKIKG